jgi:DNA-binding GntR family transcriptional regulator
VIDSLTEFTKFNTNPGYQLLGEAVLCRFFNVRRTVMRQALKEHEYKGHRRQSEVLKHEKLPATKKVADYLALEERTPVVQIDWLFDQEPIVFGPILFAF